jgi:hypothetical protein
VAWLDSDTLDKLQQNQQRSDAADSAVGIPSAAGAAVGDAAGVAYRVGDYQNRYWWMDPGAIWSMAKAGIPADHPAAQTAALAAAHVGVTQPFAFSLPGQPQPQAVQQNAVPDLTGAAQQFDKLSGRTQPGPQPNAYAQTAPNIPAKLLAGDQWDTLAPDVRADLAKLSFVADKPPDARGDRSYYRIEGFDQMSSRGREALANLTRTYAQKNGLEGSVDTYSSDPSKTWLVSAAPVKLDNPGVSVGGYDITDLGSLTAIARGAGIAASAGFQELSGQIRNAYQALSPMGERHPGDISVTDTPEQMAAAQQYRRSHPGYSNLGTAPDFTAPNWTESQSDLGIIAGDLLHGRPVNTGEGFFASGDVAAERQRREALRGQIDGHSVTLGRWLVGGTDNTPGQVLSGLIDLTLALKADPTILALKGYGAAKANASLFHDEGSVTAAYNSWRQTGEIKPALRTFFDKGGLGSLNGAVSRDEARSWTLGPETAPIREAVAANSDPYSIWVMTGRRDPALAARLAGESNPDEIGKILVDRMGVDVPKLSLGDVTGSNKSFNLGVNAPGTGPSVFRADTPARWRSMLPNHVVSPDDLNANAVTLERFASYEKMPTDWLSSKFDDLVKTTPEMRNQFWQGISKDFTTRLITEKGLKPYQAAAVTKMVENPAGDAAIYSMNQVGRGLGSWDDTAIIDGNVITLKSNPHLDVQHYGGNIFLPDYREIRRALGPTAPIWQFELGEVKPAVLADRLLTYGQNKVWKMLEVLTPKTAAKIIGDSQGAIAARGYTSMANHPIEALAIMAGDRGLNVPADPGFLARLQRATADSVRWDTLPEDASLGARAKQQVSELNPLPGAVKITKAAVRGSIESGLKALHVDPLYVNDPLGEVFAHQRELQGMFGRGFETDTDVLGSREASWWDQVPKPENPDAIGGPEYMRAVARDLSQYAASGDAAGLVRQPTLQAAKDWYWNGEGSYWRNRQISTWGHPEMAGRDAADKWVQDTWDQIMAKTNGNPTLIDAVATGKLDSQSMWATGADGSARVSPKFAAKLTGYWDDLPTMSRHPKVIYGARKEEMDRWFNRAVHAVLSKPDAAFDKSPLYRQVVWNKMVDKVPFMAAEDQAKLLSNAEQASLPDGLMSRLSTAIENNPGGSTVHVEPAASNLPPLYHGSSTPIAEIGDKYSSGSGANNLFGPGFYTTDSENIAGKYVRKGSGAEPTVYSVKWTGAEPPRLLDLERPLPADARQVVVDHANAMLGADYLDFNQETADALRRLIDNPDSTGAELYSTIRRAYGEAGLPKYEVDESLSSLSDNLESAGYDGFTHQGGLRAGQGKELHGVRVFFDPQKVSVSELPAGTSRSGGATLEAVHAAAHHEAIDMMRSTLHDFSERNQMMDSLKLLSPFGEVLRKTLNRWTDIIKENPYVLRRVQQGVQAARSPGVGALTGAPDGQGFFHQDQFGQWVFTIPFSGAINQALTGENVPLTGNVKGLTVAADFLPTLGPVMSFPVSWGLSKLDASQPIVDTIFPYGKPKGSVDNLMQFAPTWLQRALSSYDTHSPETLKAWNYATADYLRVGIAKGDYDFSTPDGISQAIDDASKKAAYMSFIRAAANFVIPGAPKPEFLVDDPGGKRFNVAVLVNEFHDMQSGKYPGIDATNAGQKFLEQYGPNVFQAITPKSFSYIYGLPTSIDAQNWVNANPSVKRDAPNVYGYFAPPSSSADFDPAIYASQLAPEGGRVALTPHQWALMSNAALAALTYRHFKEEVTAANNGKPLNNAQNAWLRDQKQALIDKYPGYAESMYGGNSLPARPDALKLLVPETLKLLNNPAVRGTDAGQGLALLAPFLEQANQGWQSSHRDPSTQAPTGWYTATSQYAADIRAWVRAQGAAIEQLHPNFGPLFDNVFDRAMYADPTPAGG